MLLRDVCGIIPADCIKNAMLIRSLCRAGRDCFEGIIPAPPLGVGEASKDYEYFLISSIRGVGDMLRDEFIYVTGVGVPGRHSYVPMCDRRDLMYLKPKKLSLHEFKDELRGYTIFPQKLVDTHAFYKDMCIPTVKKRVLCSACEYVDDYAPGQLLADGSYPKMTWCGCKTMMKWVGFKAWQ